MEYFLFIFFDNEAFTLVLLKLFKNNEPVQQIIFELFYKKKPAIY